MGLVIPSSHSRAGLARGPAFLPKNTIDALTFPSGIMSLNGDHNSPIRAVKTMIALGAGLCEAGSFRLGLRAFPRKWGSTWLSRLYP